MRLLIILITLISFFSCKSEKKSSKDIEANDHQFVINNEVEGHLFYEIILDVVVKKDDKFHVFYKDFNNSGYAPERALMNEVKGSEDVQSIVFKIPEEIIPNGLRIDFGVNYSQEPIVLKNLKIRYDKKEFYFDDGKFEQLFKPSKYASYNNTAKLIVTQPIDGAYDPNFVSVNIEGIVFPMLD
ncbi:hypothetical protein ACJOV8_005345 [Formosa sp. 3Alg 14/1]|uniref:hypothetical protein n=1 Tax=Formosa sp. 3Alg 14/1 TaxID=3382190 RepID=UPI0039BE0A77